MTTCQPRQVIDISLQGMQAQADTWRTRGRSLRVAPLRPSLKGALAEGRNTTKPPKTEVGMTRTDVMASSRPLTPGATRKTRRKLVSLPILILTALALVAPGTAFA